MEKEVSNKNNQTNDTILEVLASDLNVLLEKCQRDCYNNNILNMPYYVQELNRIIIIGTRQSLIPFADINIVEVNTDYFQDPKVDKQKYGYALLLQVEAIVSKVLARINRHHQKTVSNDTIGSSGRITASSSVYWQAISKEYSISKKTFGKSINFVTDKYKRTILFRDVEQALALASTGYYKPSVILAGSVIEELLRLYLKHKGIIPISDNFDGYIKTCESNGLLKSGISRLSDSVREFRNFIHLAKEDSKKHTITHAKAKNAIASIFVIVNDF